MAIQYYPLDIERDHYHDDPIDRIEPIERPESRAQCLQALYLLNATLPWILGHEQDEEELPPRFWAALVGLGLPLARNLESAKEQGLNMRKFGQLKGRYQRDVLDYVDAVELDEMAPLVNQAFRFILLDSYSRLSIWACGYALSLEFCEGISMTETAKKKGDSKGTLSSKMLHFHGVAKAMFPGLPDSVYSKDPASQEIYKKKRLDYCKSNLEHN